MTLSDRMKDYERRAEGRLTRRVPVLGRMDGKAFHTFTRGLGKPWDDAMEQSMWAAATALCEQLQGCVLAYVQSDEITVVLTDWANYETQAWFDYRVQKMASVAASMCALAFARHFEQVRPGLLASKPLPAFDARFWNVPPHEVENALIWRQQDATRNSIQGLGQHIIGRKKVRGMNNAQVQDALMLEHGVNWNDLPTWRKRGACVVRELYEVQNAISHVAGPVRRSRWVVDRETPIFTQDRGYIRDRLGAVNA